MQYVLFYGSSSFEREKILWEVQIKTLSLQKTLEDTNERSEEMWYALEEEG